MYQEVFIGSVPGGVHCQHVLIGSRCSLVVYQEVFIGSVPGGVHW